MNARDINRRTVNSQAGDRSNRAITLVWSEGSGRSVQARWISDCNSRQGVLRGESYGVIAG